MLEIRRYFQLLGGAPDRQIVHENKALFEGPVRDPAQFSKLQIVQVLHATQIPMPNTARTKPKVLPVGQSMNKLSKAKTADTA